MRIKIDTLAFAEQIAKLKLESLILAESAEDNRKIAQDHERSRDASAVQAKAFHKTADDYAARALT